MLELDRNARVDSTTEDRDFNGPFFVLYSFCGTLETDLGLWILRFWERDIFWCPT